ncbi:UvrD-helicase domain-containing protein [Halobacillus litoralis]|uniref:RNA polymerase recycling motor HelD n=1 Tax=Halobacillus litoralis TaxID=45668 RepID=UPI001CD7A0FC|nr:RNA polymerase recycling motor HelD [Halobacillus litoralis]MCA0970798.1 UvrD-helicase domain-containing protein [Halobacillus litoralis]
MDEQIRNEQQYLNEVMETIQKQIHDVEADSAKRKEEVIQIRKHFWDDLKVNMDTFDDYLETIIGMRQQAQDLSVIQGTHWHAYDRLKKLKRIEESPYFGRIDFREEGADEAERIHIGVATVTDEANENILIYDWRAPISSVYYDYPPGPAEYETPGGTIEGHLDKKWQYTIRNGVIESMFDTSLTIGDEILQSVLGQGTNKHMQSIVATIQRDQNHIIRNVGGKLLVVQGAAGSGKTSAALQRIAYFLYKYRDTLKADQIILFTPNNMFSNYVSHVLPELGEENMEQETFQDYLNYRLRDSFKVEDPYDQLEFLLEAEPGRRYDTRKASIRFKSSATFFEGMRRYREALESSGMMFRGIKFRGKSVATSKEITDFFYQEHTSMRFLNRIEKLKEWLLKKIDQVEKEERKKAWVQEEIELLSKDELQKVFNNLEEDSFEYYDKENRMLARYIVRSRMKSLRKKIESLEFIHVKKLYNQLFDASMDDVLWNREELPPEWEDIRILTKEMLERDELHNEDATPYLLLKELIQGFQSNTSIKYVLIDEAQDYSIFQFEFIKRLFPAARMTVLGDFNQAIFAHSHDLSDFNDLSSLYGPDETELIELDRSYRSTKEIIEFTRELVPEGKQIKAFEREGEQPTMNVVEDKRTLHRSIRQRVEELQASGSQTVAIICKSATESAAAYESLRSSMEDLTLVRKNTEEYQQGVVVIPAYLAKGIEFDSVIIYNASEEVYGEEHLRRLFYTACTRAMHHLHLYSVGEPSFLMDDVQQGRMLVAQR